MMVVVPAFTEGQQRQEPVVLAGVGRLIAARAEQMRKRIDREGVVPQQHGAQAERPDEQVPSANQPDHRPQRNGRNHVIFIQPAQLGEFREIADVIEARVVVFIRHDPADVRPEKSE